MKAIQGIAASDGKVLGKALILRSYSHGSYIGELISEDEVSKNLQDLRIALLSIKEDIAQNIEKAKNSGKESTAAIMGAHIQILEDPELISQLELHIGTELWSAKYAVQSVFDDWMVCFRALEDPYLSERSHDLNDLKQQLLNRLCSIPTTNLEHLKEPVILIAKDVTPSLLASADSSKLLGIISEVGSKTSHTAILASNLGLPAVLGIKNAVDIIDEDSIIFLDGNEGVVKTHLGDTDLNVCLDEISKNKESHLLIEAYKKQKTRTKDDVEIELSANIMSIEDAELALSEGAEGVGLFRTEFLFMDRLEAPTEEEQYQVYAKTAEMMGGKSVIIRTMDIGGDKTVDYLHMDKEENPFLGLRALRLSFEREFIFMTQLRAILRASVHGNIKIMFPMVASVEELIKAKALLFAAMNELRQEGQCFDENLSVGVMIEIPSAAIIADQLIKHCDFFSIGTNDLTQYTLAVDRMNEHIAHLYNPVHPAMLRLIKNVADAARIEKANKFAGMCGELAGNPKMAKLLIGLGLTELSMSPRKIAQMRFEISKFTLEEAKEFAREVLCLESAEAINEALSK